MITKTLKLSWILTLFLNILKVRSARTCIGVALMVHNIPLLSSAHPQNQFPKGLHFQLLTLIMSPLCLNLIIQTWWGHHLKDDTMATFKISPFPTSKSFTKIYQYTEFLCLFIAHSIETAILPSNLIACQPTVREDGMSGLTDPDLPNPCKYSEFQEKKHCYFEVTDALNTTWDKCLVQ